MADSSLHSCNNSHFQDPNPTSFPSSVPTKPPKSKFFLTHYFFSKSMVIVLVVLVFSYFPSQLPEFFNKTTIRTKLWELIYLLVIGIAVCYGLFSRKTDAVHISNESVHADGNLGAKETYLSGISHISSIFEDGIHNSYGFDEKDLSEEPKGLGSRFSEIGNGFVKSDVKNLNQYFLGESMVVINDEKYVLDQLGKQKSIKQNKPLRLPVRNLGSKSLDSAAGKSGKDSTSDWDEIKSGKFRGLMPIKLEDKFKETDSDADSDSDSRTLLKWRSKSMRLEKLEDMFSTEANETSNFRPPSVGILDNGDQKSQSMRFSMPLKTKNYLEKDEWKHMETKLRQVSIGRSSEMNDRNHSSSEEFGKPKVDDGTLDSKYNATFIKSKSQQSSIGASSETNLENFKNVLVKEKKANSFDSIPSPAPASNTYKKGKSVRTNRPKEQVLDAKVKAFPSQTGEKLETEPHSTDVIFDESRRASYELSDTEPHSGEVDRKADEFIAKFREQIRLQKLASARKLNL